MSRRLMIAMVMLIAAALFGAPVLPAAAMSIERVSGASGVEAWLVRGPFDPIVTLAFAFAGGAALDPVGKEVPRQWPRPLRRGSRELRQHRLSARLGELAGELEFGAGQDELSGSLRMLTRNSDRDRRSPARCA